MYVSKMRFSLLSQVGEERSRQVCSRSNLRFISCPRGLNSNRNSPSSEHSRILDLPLKGLNSRISQMMHYLVERSRVPRSDVGRCIVRRIQEVGFDHKQGHSGNCAHSFRQNSVLSKLNGKANSLVPVGVVHLSGQENNGRHRNNNSGPAACGGKPFPHAVFIWRADIDLPERLKIDRHDGNNSCDQRNRNKKSHAAHSVNLPARLICAIVSWQRTNVNTPYKILHNRRGHE